PVTTATIPSSLPAMSSPLVVPLPGSVRGDEDVLDVRERVQRVGSELAPEPGPLEPTEGRGVADAAVRVDREVTGLDAASDAQGAPDVTGPQGPREAVRRVVGLAYRIGLVVER